MIASCSHVSLRRLFLGSKGSKGATPVAYGDLRTPDGSALIKYNASISACVAPVHLGVSHVLPRRGLPQVGNAVVVPHTVDVVEESARPPAVVIEPRQTVRAVQNAINADHNVPVLLARRWAMRAPAPGEAPSENTSLRVVFHHLDQPFLGQVFLIDYLANLKKVGDAVVFPIKVSMANATSRVPAVKASPSKIMRSVCMAIDLHCKAAVSATDVAARNISWPTLRAASRFPFQFSRLWVVVEQAANFFGGEFCHFANMGGRRLLAIASLVYVGGGVA